MKKINLCAYWLLVIMFVGAIVVSGRKIFKETDFNSFKPNYPTRPKNEVSVDPYVKYVTNKSVKETEKLIKIK